MASTSATLEAIANHLDTLLNTSAVPDCPGAWNGIQVEHQGPVRRCAVAVDASLRTIQGAVDAGANLLIVHHGLFWSAARPLCGRFYHRTRLLFEHDIAVYSSHLPLDLHPSLGNNALLARALALEPTGGFASFQSTQIGVMGESDVDTATLIRKAEVIASHEG